jgi:hypothetical protein
LIKIKEEYSEQNNTQIQKIRVKADRKREINFENYPVIVMSNDVEYVHYEIQKKEGGGGSSSSSSSSSPKDDNDKKGGILERAKEKALELKDSVSDTTKQLSNDQKKE